MKKFLLASVIFLFPINSYAENSILSEFLPFDIKSYHEWHVIGVHHKEAERYERAHLVPSQVKYWKDNGLAEPNEIILFSKIYTSYENAKQDPRPIISAVHQNKISYQDLTILSQNLNHSFRITNNLLGDRNDLLSHPQGTLNVLLKIHAGQSGSQAINDYVTQAEKERREKEQEEKKQEEKRKRKALEERLGPTLLKSCKNEKVEETFTLFRIGNPYSIKGSCFLGSISGRLNTNDVQWVDEKTLLILPSGNSLPILFKGDSPIETDRNFVAIGASPAEYTATSGALTKPLTLRIIKYLNE